MQGLFLSDLHLEAWLMGEILGRKNSSLLQLPT